MAELVIGHELPEQCRTFTTTASRFGASEIQVDVRGKAARRIALNRDHDLVVGTHANQFVGAAYVEPYPQLASTLGERDAGFLRWLIVDDEWRGRSHRGERVADAMLANTLDVLRQRGSRIAAGLVHVNHTASIAMLNRAGFIDISDLVERRANTLLLMGARLSPLIEFDGPPPAARRGESEQGLGP